MNSIDLLVKTENEIIILENKVKSSQHSRQLEKYRKYVEQEFPNVSHHYIFLTLASEVPHDNNWKHVSYNKIYDLLTNLSLKDHKHKIIIEDYILNLNKILSSLKSVLHAPEIFDSVFLNGKLKKKDKLTLIFSNPIEDFISKNQLETIFQKAFLSNLLMSQEFSEMKGFMNETRGTALIDFPIEHNIQLKGRKEKYTTFIQLQGDNIKFAFAVQEKYNKSKKVWVEPVLKLFKELKESDDTSFTSYNPPKSKAYVSVSRKTPKFYWKMTKNEISNMILNEINYGKKLTEELINKLN